LDIIIDIFLNSLVPVFLVAGVGWLLAHFYRPDVRGLSRVSLAALIPCLIFSTLISTRIDLLESGRMGIFCGVVVIVSGLFARLAARLMHLDRSATIGLMLVIMFTNVGNFGLPVIALAFGQEALAQGTVYFIFMNLLMYTVGIALVSSKQVDLKAILVNMLKMPAILSVFVALLVIAFKAEVPKPIMSAVDMIGKAALPVNLLILGMQLHQYRLNPTRLVWVGVVLRLAIVPLSVLPVIRLLGLSGTALQAGMLQAATPAGVSTTILAAEYEVEPSFVSNVVVLSTLFSVVTLIPLIALI